MSSKGQTTKGDSNGNLNRSVAIPTLDAKDNEGPNEQKAPRALYWSPIHHKNLHEDIPTTNAPENENLLGRKEGNEAQRYESMLAPSPVSPQILQQSPGGNGNANSRWSRVKEDVESKELFIRHIDHVDGDVGEPRASKKWSDLALIEYDFSLRECLILFLAFLTVGALAFSFLFEKWSILDSLYFTSVLLTTVGYGDMTPSSPGGKLFASVFAIGGIVVFGLVLGVLGSELVEAEIGYTERVKSKASRTLEAALTRGSHSKRGEEEKIARYIETGERSLSRSYSASSMDSTESDSTDGSLYDQESSTRSHLLMEPWHHPSDKKDKLAKKRFPGLSFIQRQLPGITPMLVGGVVMAHLEQWGWYDAIYYCVVTATTIGFGDITPVGTAGKCCAILFIPIVVGTMGYILGNVASFIVDQRRAKHSERLSSKELKIEDIEALDEGCDGGVSELEYIKFMLVAMQKVDGALFSQLSHQFHELDLSGDGQITKKDLKMSVTRKMKSVSHKMKLYQYKMKMLKGESSGIIAYMNMSTK